MEHLRTSPKFLDCVSHCKCIYFSVLKLSWKLLLDPILTGVSKHIWLFYLFSRFTYLDNYSLATCMCSSLSCGVLWLPKMLPTLPTIPMLLVNILFTTEEDDFSAKKVQQAKNFINSLYDNKLETILQDETQTMLIQSLRVLLDDTYSSIRFGINFLISMNSQVVTLLIASRPNKKLKEFNS